MCRFIYQKFIDIHGFLRRRISCDRPSAENIDDNLVAIHVNSYEKEVLCNNTEIKLEKLLENLPKIVAEKTVPVSPPKVEIIPVPESISEPISTPKVENFPLPESISEPVSSPKVGDILPQLVLIPDPEIKNEIDESTNLNAPLTICEDGRRTPNLKQIIEEILFTKPIVGLSMAITQIEDGSSPSPGNNDSQDFYAVYEVKEVLGRGMSSVVRRCVEWATKREYAVKILDVTSEKMTQTEADDLRRSTKREIQMLRAVAGHENIISLHDFYETSTFLFIVFELARCGELFDYLTEVVTLSEKKTRHIMRQLFGAVSTLHTNNIVHRDLKPENILMMDDEKIKLTDFGFAYQLARGERMKELLGTPGYLAPETLAASMQENSPGYDVQVDMWACGVIMYTLLCGYAPFFHRQQLRMLRAISEGKFEFRSPEWDEIGSSAKDLINKLLVVEPGKRLTSQQALDHPFIALAAQPAAEVKFNPRKRFRLAILQVRMIVRLLRILKVPMLIPVTSARCNPYADRKVRKQVDAVAFKVYGHWVKKGREQYRDALFANTPNQDRSTSNVTF